MTKLDKFGQSFGVGDRVHVVTRHGRYMAEFQGVVTKFTPGGFFKLQRDECSYEDLVKSEFVFKVPVKEDAK